MFHLHSYFTLQDFKFIYLKYKSIELTLPIRFYYQNTYKKNLQLLQTKYSKTVTTKILRIRTNHSPTN